MMIGEMITSFILDEWLYSISHGVYHVLINVFVMLFFFKVVISLRMIPAVFLTLIVNIIAGVVFALFAMAMVYYIPVDKYAHTQQELYSSLVMAFGLGTMYAVIQSILFVIISRIYHLNMHYAIIVAFISNAISALCVYALS